MKLRMVKSDDPLEKITTAQAIQILLDNYRSSEYYQAAQARVQEISQFRGTILDSGGSLSSHRWTRWLWFEEEEEEA